MEELICLFLLAEDGDTSADMPFYRSLTDFLTNQVRFIGSILEGHYQKKQGYDISLIWSSNFMKWRRSIQIHLFQPYEFCIEDIYQRKRCWSAKRNDENVEWHAHWFWKVIFDCHFETLILIDLQKELVKFWWERKMTDGLLEGNPIRESFMSSLITRIHI